MPDQLGSTMPKEESVSLRFDFVTAARVLLKKGLEGSEEFRISFRRCLFDQFAICDDRDKPTAHDAALHAVYTALWTKMGLGPVPWGQYQGALCTNKREGDLREDLNVRVLVEAMTVAKDQPVLAMTLLHHNDTTLFTLEADKFSCENLDTHKWMQTIEDPAKNSSTSSN